MKPAAQAPQLAYLGPQAMHRCRNGLVLRGPRLRTGNGAMVTVGCSWDVPRKRDEMDANYTIWGFLKIGVPQ